MKDNIIYGSIFLVITIIGIVLFYFLYQSNYVNFNNDDIKLSLDNEYWTNGNVTITVDYNGKINVKEYSFNGGKTWQSENKYTAKENEKLQIVLKGSYGKQSVPIAYRVGNIDKEYPNIVVADKIYTAVGSEFNLDNYYVVDETVSTIKNVTVTGIDAIDTATIGEYEVDIEAVDAAGNTSNKTVVIAVVNKKDPNLSTNQKGPVNVIGISVDKTRVNLVKGSKVKIVPTVKPINASNKKVTWKSINTSVAKVDSKGVITAVNAGSTTISVTTVDGAKVSDISVVVSDQAIEVDSVTLDKKNDTFTTDDPDIVLTATVKPDTATNTDLTWSSSNLSVATVEDGVVSIRGEGETTIAAASANGKIATYHLTIKDSYVFQEREILRRKEVIGYHIVIYKNGVDITKEVTNISDPIQVRHNRKKQFELTMNQHHTLKDKITILYDSDKHEVTRAQN